MKQKIDFYVTNKIFPTQAFYISGNCDELGNNEISKALRMDILEEDNWFLSVEVDISKINTTFLEFSYNICKWDDQNQIIHSNFLTRKNHIKVDDLMNYSYEIHETFQNDPKIVQIDPIEHIYLDLTFKYLIDKEEEAVFVIGPLEELGIEFLKHGIRLKKQSDDLWTIQNRISIERVIQCEGTLTFMFVKSFYYKRDQNNKFELAKTGSFKVDEQSIISWDQEHNNSAYNLINFKPFRFKIEQNNENTYYVPNLTNLFSSSPPISTNSQPSWSCINSYSSKRKQYFQNVKQNISLYPLTSTSSNRSLQKQKFFQSYSQSDRETRYGGGENGFNYKYYNIKNIISKTYINKEEIRLIENDVSDIVEKLTKGKEQIKVRLLCIKQINEKQKQLSTQGQDITQKILFLNLALISQRFIQSLDKQDKQINSIDISNKFLDLIYCYINLESKDEEILLDSVLYLTTKFFSSLSNEERLKFKHIEDNLKIDFPQSSSFDEKVYEQYRIYNALKSIFESNQLDFEMNLNKENFTENEKQSEYIKNKCLMYITLLYSLNMKKQQIIPEFLKKAQKTIFLSISSQKSTFTLANIKKTIEDLEDQKMELYQKESDMEEELKQSEKKLIEKWKQIGETEVIGMVQFKFDLDKLRKQLEQKARIFNVKAKLNDESLFKQQDNLIDQLYDNQNMIKGRDILNNTYFETEITIQKTNGNLKAEDVQQENEEEQKIQNQKQQLKELQQQKDELDKQKKEKEESQIKEEILKRQQMEKQEKEQQKQLEEQKEQQEQLRRIQLEELEKKKNEDLLMNTINPLLNYKFQKSKFAYSANIIDHGMQIFENVISQESAIIGTKFFNEGVHTLKFQILDLPKNSNELNHFFVALCSNTTRQYDLQCPSCEQTIKNICSNIRIGSVISVVMDFNKNSFSVHENFTGSNFATCCYKKQKSLAFSICWGFAGITPGKIKLIIQSCD